MVYHEVLLIENCGPVLETCFHKLFISYCTTFLFTEHTLSLRTELTCKRVYYQKKALKCNCSTEYRFLTMFHFIYIVLLLPL